MTDQTTPSPNRVDSAKREAAERQAAEFIALGVECTADEILLASAISDQVESAITLGPELATKGTRLLASADPKGLLLCIFLARTVVRVREVDGADNLELAGALCHDLVGVLAELTKGKAKELSRLGR